jgi:hypothetical protein
MPQRHRHDPLARDANLRKVQRATAWTFVGGVALTGGFYAAGAQAFSGAAHNVSPATVVGSVDDTTGTESSTTIPAPPVQTSPSVVAPPESPADTTTTVTIPIAPPTQPVTLPHKKKHVSQPAPVVSGGS